MSKIIKGPWKDKEYDPSEDPEFDLGTNYENYAYVAITIMMVLIAMAIIWFM